ncbi:MAG: hypothetical protein FJX02_07360 [Alphaproteobacteria bacterium]|nr:hypothetical protein [Alphaproteobacteria bacterium]
MLLAAFGEAVEPMLIGEAGMEFLFGDLGLETLLLSMRHWSLVELLLAAGAAAVVLPVLAGRGSVPLAASTPADPDRGDKVPIKLH